MKKWGIFVIIGGAIILIILSVFIFNKPKGINSTDEALTLNDLYQKGITNYINKEITIKSKVSWDYCSGFHIPEAPPPPKDIVNKICGNLRVNFEDFKGCVSGCGDFKILSDSLGKKNNIFGKEGYTFNNVGLSKNREYLLIGSLRYREWLIGNKSAEEIENFKSNPKIIEQNNNPVYWSQSFEFELKDIDNL